MTEDTEIKPHHLSSETTQPAELPDKRILYTPSKTRKSSKEELRAYNKYKDFIANRGNKNERDQNLQ